MSAHQDLLLTLTVSLALLIAASDVIILNSVSTFAPASLEVTTSAHAKTVMNLAKTCTTVLKSTSATATTVAANTTASTSKEDSSVLAQKVCSCILMERAVSSNVTLAKMSDQTKSAPTLL